jgi:hypothetical protein
MPAAVAGSTLLARSVLDARRIAPSPASAASAANTKD